MEIKSEVVHFNRLGALKGVPQPFPYQGSKRYLSNAIVPLIPKNTERIIEPFCGSAAVSVATLFSGRAKTALLADINRPLMDLWNAILLYPKELVDDYENLWNEQMDNPQTFL